jgi:A/G-specific adenine glycosylase
MLELPGTPWRESPWAEPEAQEFAPVPGLAWRRVPGIARHGFTHFELEMLLLAASVPQIEAPAGMEARGLAEAGGALPTVMRKLLNLPG